MLFIYPVNGMKISLIIIHYVKDYEYRQGQTMCICITKQILFAFLYVIYFLFEVDHKKQRVKNKKRGRNCTYDA